MKWTFESPEAGDMIRVKIGSIYHYGIFVSEDETIEFGKPPNYYVGEFANEEKQVCSVDVYSFLSGGMLERGTLDRHEIKKAFKPEEIVERAKKRLGERGYNVIHNNCEHFVYECVFGVKKSIQEEEMRKKWNRRAVADVYVSTEDFSDLGVFPKERQAEIDSVTSEKVKKEKTNVWALLETGVKNTFRYDMNVISFSKQKNGKWTADKFYFSLSHSDGICAVIVSDKPCGIDVENADRFHEKCADKSFIGSFSKAIGCENETDERNLLAFWTRKESVFKSMNKNFFEPKKISAEGKNTRTFSFGNFILSVTTESPDKIVFRKVEREKPKLMIAEEILCR